ncbi:SHOCT domain-containing protein [Caulobacter sp. KR2-114]|uniref:SHOCT domain-containing protein n=1 Tax=Caulobacter sp. KR2-114 TaxID=3400912 RepID=UPI003C009E2E
MSDNGPDARLFALERLAALLEKGLLTREEFDAQKAVILAGGEAPPQQAVPEPVVPLPDPVEPAVEPALPPPSEPTEAEPAPGPAEPPAGAQSPRGPSVPAIALGVSAAIAVAALGAVLWMLWSRAPPTGPSAATNAMSAATEAASVALPAPPTLDDAFALVFGAHGSAVTTQQWQHDAIQVRYTPQKLIPITGGYAVVAKGDVVDAAHVNSGFLGVAYLTPGPAGWAVSGKWPQLVETGSFGAIDGWRSRDELFDNPGLEVDGGYQGQGCAVQSADLVELTPGAPTVRARLLLLFDYPSPDTADQPTPDPADGAAIQYGHSEAKIAALVKGQSFKATYDGDYARTVTYSLNGPGLFRASANVKTLPGC